MHRVRWNMTMLILMTIAAVAGVCTQVNAVGDPTGACCLPGATCMSATEAECDALGGAYLGDDTQCGEEECPTFGACCIPFGLCTTTTIQHCFGDLGGVLWAPGQSCGSYTCPPLGACCYPDGLCQVTSESSCRVVHDGVYQGDGVDCAASACAPCLEDLDGDRAVGIGDLLLVLGAWGAGGGDVTGDGTTDVADLLAVLSAWGPCV